MTLDTGCFNQTRVEQNLKALVSLRSRHPDPTQLQAYSGWGGLRDAIYTKPIYRQLKQCLSDKDIDSIKQTVKTAYYTPAYLIDFIYQALAKIGCQPRRILEPAAGHGAFIAHMPKAMRQSANITAVEIDTVSSQLLTILYPEVTVKHQRFEQFQPDEPFDLIIGNPPFGQFQVVDEAHADLQAVSIHHYFVAKSMRLLTPGGILAMVLPRYFLDCSKKHVRQIIAKEGGTLLSAIRLPDDLFADAKVTVDLVFLQKTTGDLLWTQTQPFTQGQKTARVNAWLQAHPAQIIGKLQFIEVYDRTEITCQRMELDVQAELTRQLRQLSMPTGCDLTHSKQRLTLRLAMLKQEIQQLTQHYQKLKTIAQQIEQSELNLQQLYQQALIAA